MVLPFIKVNSLMPFAYLIYMPSMLPSYCVCICGKDFTLSPALSCAHGAFPIIQHNEVRDLTASLMTEVLMSRWSHTYMPSLVRLCITAQLCLMVMPEWISKQLDFGGAYVIAPFLMSVVLILLQLPIIPPF